MNKNNQYYFIDLNVITMKIVNWGISNTATLTGETLENMKRLSEMMKESEAKQKDPDYQKARSVKKVTVTELHKILTKKFKADGYINLNFENPQIDRYVIVPFTVQDEKKSRKKDKSIKDLRRIFNFTLDNLNWRLMSDGIEYRMGYLKGRLKGYENDDELAKFIKKRNKKKPLYWDEDGPVKEVIHLN